MRIFETFELSKYRFDGAGAILRKNGEEAIILEGLLDPFSNDWNANYTRAYVNNENFNVAFVIPTGIDCRIGGHAGDATKYVKLISSICDKIIINPNCVNASDINEMPENAIYTEGSTLTRLIKGNIALNKRRKTKILAVIGKNKIKYLDFAINSIKAAECLLGIEIDFCILEEDISALGFIDPYRKESKRVHNGFKPTGVVSNVEALRDLLNEELDGHDAIAITTKLDIDLEYQKKYFKDHNLKFANPMGAVESMISHYVSIKYDIPCAHAPMFSSDEDFDYDHGIVCKEKAAEMISNSFFFSVLKGLTKSYEIYSNRGRYPPQMIGPNEIHALVVPFGVSGELVEAATMQNIPIVGVKNSNVYSKQDSNLPESYISENYAEAVGHLLAIKEGIKL